MVVLRRFSLLGLFTLISVHAALVAVNAQSLTGRLTGTVTDAQGAVLPGADVTMTNRESKDVQRTVTNAEGVFVFAAVSAGTYSVKVELQGFSPWEATDLEMRLGERRTLTTIRLQVGGVSEVISVQARPEIAPVESGEKSARLTSEQIQNVPMVGRSAAELLKLLPGMTPISGDTSNNPGFNGEIIGINGNGDGGKQSALGNFSGNGTRADALDIVIDGAHAADPGCNCATSVNPNPDMVGEFRVLQSNYGAEHAKGPVTIDVISKAGGRNFERVAAEQVQHGTRRGEQAEEPVRLSGLQPRRAAADSRHRLQQGPQQGLLLHRLRVLQAAAGYRHPAVVGADRGHDQRRLLGYRVVRLAG
jgi:Carboxypeptidase regulatory-like domain